MTDKRELIKNIRKTTQSIQFFDYGWSECEGFIDEYIKFAKIEVLEEIMQDLSDTKSLSVTLDRAFLKLSELKDGKNG